MNACMDSAPYPLFLHSVYLHGVGKEMESVARLLQELRDDLNIDCFVRINPKLGFEIIERGAFGIKYSNPRICEVSRSLPHIKQFLKDLYIVEAAIQCKNQS